MAADFTHLALSEDGSMLAVSGPDTLDLFTFGSTVEHRPVPFPFGAAAVQAMAFAGNAVLTAALDVGVGQSEFARPALIFYLDPLTGEWTQAPTQPDGRLGLITSVVAIRDSVAYLFVDAAITGDLLAASAELWVIGVDNIPAKRFISLPVTATLMDYPDMSVILAEHDETGAYHIVQRSGGDVMSTLGCLRPGSVQNLNDDPDKQ